MTIGIILGVLSLATIASIGAVVFLLSRSKSNQEGAALPVLFELQKDITAFKSDLQQQVIHLSEQVNSHLTTNSKHLQDTQQHFHRTVSQVQGQLGQLQQATANMVDIGKDISSLQSILQAPKLRGGLGELLLSELLKQILPEDHFSLQYGFLDGSIVDAVIFLGEGSIPVDAKFPLENFRRIQEAEEGDAKAAKKAFYTDVKKHVDAIASKYIRPQEGTFEFALMYIPAENVYYETIIKDEVYPESIASYAMDKKVIPVSPNSFYAYLQAIVRGLKGMKIERSAQVILESLGQLQVDIEKCFVEFDKMGTHLSNASSSYDRAMKKFEKLQTRLSSLDDVRKSQLSTGSNKEIHSESV